MTRVCVVCEGQTEETFVSRVLAPSFSPVLNVHAQTIETSPGYRGGSLSYDRVLRQLSNTLRQKSAPIVTTMIDLYALDKHFPGYEAAMAVSNLEQKLNLLKAALHDRVVAEARCAPQRFIPYIQPYEFEALLFSDVAGLVSLEPPWAKWQSALQQVRDQAESPEHINNHPETKPAAHLERWLRNPSYHKTRHGPLATERIGLSRIEHECRFFAAWLQQLRQIAPADSIRFD